MADRPERSARTRASYDAVADAYVENIHDELDAKPFDREWLTDFATRVGTGPACDVGCGPGHLAAFLRDRGCDPVIGVDLSPGLLARATALHPGIRFVEDDMVSLTTQPDEAFAGVICHYAIIHLDEEQREPCLASFARVLRPGGWLSLAYHISDPASGTTSGGDLHLDEWWGVAVDVDFSFLEPDRLTEYAEAAGLRLVRDARRGPIPEVEHASERAYQLFAKP